MTAKDKLYPAFKKDLAALREQTPDNAWLGRLAANAALDWHNYKEQHKIVDRIDASLPNNAPWRNIRTAYKLRGTDWK